MTVYPLPRLAPTVTEAGITAPTFEDLLASYQAKYHSIYGADVSLDAATKDGGWLAYLSSMQHDMNNACIGSYLSYSPTYALGVHLALLVKINGLAKLAGSNATEPVRLVGTVGEVITNGVIRDDLGNLWDLPASVTIAVSGDVVTTARCREAGNISPAAFTIESVTRGWQNVAIAGSLTPGLPVETDPQLRLRQRISTGGPALTTSGSLRGAIAALAGVTRFAIYENDQAVTDPINGLPPHSISVIVDGLQVGSAQDVAQVIADKKNLGVTTIGSTLEIIVDEAGIPKNIRFDFATNFALSFLVAIHPGVSYVNTTANQIILAMVQMIATHPIGQYFNLDKAYLPVNLSGADAVTGTGIAQTTLDRLSGAYNVRNIYLARNDMVASETLAGPISALHVVNVSNFAAGVPIALAIDGGGFFRTTCTGVAGTQISFAPALPGGSAITIGALVYAQNDIIFALNESVVSTIANGHVELV